MDAMLLGLLFCILSLDIFFRNIYILIFFKYSFENMASDKDKMQSD